MSAGSERREAADNSGLGRFLRGTIMERFLANREEELPPRTTVALGGGAPVAVAITDTVREATAGVRGITETMPVTDPGNGEVGRAITEYTTTIPAVTQQITETVTRITGT